MDPVRERRCRSGRSLTDGDVAWSVTTVVLGPGRSGCSGSDCWRPAPRPRRARPRQPRRPSQRRLRKRPKPPSWRHPLPVAATTAGRRREAAEAADGCPRWRQARGEDRAQPDRQDRGANCRGRPSSRSRSRKRRCWPSRSRPGKLRPSSSACRGTRLCSSRLTRSASTAAPGVEVLRSPGDYLNEIGPLAARLPALRRSGRQPDRPEHRQGVRGRFRREGHEANCCAVA